MTDGLRMQTGYEMVPGKLEDVGYNDPMKNKRPTLNEVKDAIQEKISYIRENYDVGRIGIFGSVARQDDSLESDVDLLVEFDHPIGFIKFIRLEDYLGTVLGRKVDLVTRNALKSGIKEDILKDVVYV